MVREFLTFWFPQHLHQIGGSGSALEVMEKMDQGAEKKGKTTELLVCCRKPHGAFELLRDEEHIVSQNVLGYIPGRDSVLTEELGRDYRTLRSRGHH